MLGLRFSKWVVLCKDEDIDIHGAKWICVCDCGTRKSVWGHALRKGKSRSCGCGPRFRPQVGKALQKLYRQYEDNARDRGIEWNLSPEQVKEITSSPCHYTGRLPESSMKARGGEIYRYNGIDRLDSSLGYVPGNVVPCCKDANYAKLTLAESAFLHLVKEIYHHRRLHEHLHKGSRAFDAVPA